MDDIQAIPGFLFFDHIGIAVAAGQLERHVRAYQRLGFLEVHREDVLGPDQVREVLLRVGAGPNCVQLLEPLAPESPVARRLARSNTGAGFSHLAFRVSDIEKAFDFMKANGFNVIDQHPRAGSRGTKVFFVHPKTTEQLAFGYLIEIVQQSSAHGSS